jgi:hypothetical protein
MLEIGDTATPFEHRSYGDELQKCMRYYERDVNNKEIICSLTAFSSSAGYGSYDFMVRKRANPTITFQTASNYRWRIAGNNRTLISAGASGITTDNFRVDAGVTAGQVVSGEAGWLSKLTGDTFIEIDAEL